MIDFLSIYCLATGKPIAQINDDEAGMILEACGSDIESLCLSSMRPSLPWMRVTPDSLNRMRDIAPRELLAYLMNRMYAPIENPIAGKPFNVESWQAARRMRIAIWKTIESADFGEDNLDRLLLILLELDSRFNLAKMQKPQDIRPLGFVA